MLIFSKHPRVHQQRPLDVNTSMTGYIGSCLSLYIMELSRTGIPVVFPKIDIDQPTLHAEICIQLPPLRSLWHA